MQQSLLKIVKNDPLTSSVYRLQLQGQFAPLSPGQFVNLRLDGLYLRRPLSVCNAEGFSLSLIYKVVGQGTEMLSTLLPGQMLDVLTGLGNGYDLSRAGDHPLLLGGGVGIPPLFYLARQLAERGKKVSVVLGFNTREEVFLVDAFRALGVEITLVTADGSAGTKGFVTDALPEEYSYFYACGPEPMLREVYRKTTASGEFSLEERMGCGFGACMGCSMRMKDGTSKRVCKEGPVFRKEELPWET